MPGGAHLLELSAKMRLERDDYLVTQRLYRGWALAGIPLAGALIATLWLAILSSRQGPAFAAAAFAFVLLLTTLLLFFVRIRPVNQETQGWTVAPLDWQKLRERWEYGHAINAWLTLAALVAVIVAALAPEA